MLRRLCFLCPLCPVEFAPGDVAPDSWGNRMLHLFGHSTYGRYYFGDNYGPRIADFGYTRYDAFHRNYGCDPLFADFSWRFGRDYSNRLDGWHRYLATHEDFRPRRTFREQRELFARNHDNRVVGATSVAADLEEVVQSRELPVAVARLSDQEWHDSRGTFGSSPARHVVESRAGGRGQPGDRANAVHPPSNR